MRTRAYLLSLLALGILVLSSRTGQAENRSQSPRLSVPAQRLQTQAGFRVLLPAVFYAQPPACDPIPGQQYEAIPIEGKPITSPPAEQHPDINALAVRGYVLTNEAKTLIDYGGHTDPGAPRLYSLFLDNRVPQFPNVYKVYNWDWDRMVRTTPITTPPVTLLGMGTSRGEVLRLPWRNASDIYQGTYWALVLYASTERITLVYTRFDTVAWGYTIHVEGLCVEPGLLNLYQQQNAAGRRNLPALKQQQPFGRANGAEIKVAIRDTGSFMDPRSRKDWW